MTNIDFFETINFVHPTMPGQAMLAAALRSVCGCAHSDSQDLSEMLLVSLYTFVGWYIMSRLLRARKKFKKDMKAKSKDMCLIDLDYSDDELEEVKDEKEWSLERNQISPGIALAKHQSSGLAPLEHCGGVFGAELDSWALTRIERSEPRCDVAKPNMGMVLLEHYGAFGAAPGSWALVCNEEPEPKHSVVKDNIVNLGMALLEHYGVFDAAPGSWVYPQYES